jgi:hypothetical protein
MKICTVVTHDDYYYRSMVNSCEKLGLQLKLLGWGEKWKDFYWRFNLMKEYLQSLDPNEIVVFIDAFDVIPLLPEKDILERFLSFNSPIVISSEEKFSNIVLDFGYKDIFSKFKDGYCNCGSYMGYVKYLLKMYDVMDQYRNNCGDDQVVMSRSANDPFILKNVSLDKNNNIFLTLRTNEKIFYRGIMDIDNKYYTYINGIMRWKINKPAFVHGPGSVNLDHFVIDNNLTKPIREPKGSDVYKRFNQYLGNTKTLKYLFLKL